MSLREGYKETEIGVIPEDWEVSKLGEILNVQTGKKNAQDAVENGEYPFFTRSVDTQRIDTYSQDTEALFIAGEGNFTVKYYKGKFDIHQRTYMLTCIKDNSVDLKFLQNSIQPRIFKLVATSVGSTVQSLRKPIIENLQIPLPPLEEQKKIADILSTVDQKIDLIDTQINDTGVLKKGLMQKLLTQGIGHSEFKESEIGRIPVGWEVVEIKELGQVVTGSTPKTANKEFYDNGTRLWASPSDLGKSKEIKITNTMLSDLGFEQTRILPARSILVTCIGSTIGKIGIAVEEMSTNQQINSVVCNQKNDADFYYYVLDQKKDYIKKLAGTQAVPLLNKTDFSIIKVPSVPFEEQKQIAEILSATDEKLESLQEKKEAYETLKKGLMQKLLTGKVRV